MDMDLVGRQPHLRHLTEELERARSGRLRVVVVDGAVGAGKTTLLRAFVDGLGDERVLATRGDRAESEVGFGMLAQLLACAPAGTTKPERGGAVERPDRGGAVEMGEALLALVRPLLAGERPLVLVVDDVQWADDASQQALAFALRRLRADRVLCLLAMSAAASELSDGLRHLATELASTLRVTGLDPGELRELAEKVAGPISAWAAARLHQLTGGNVLHARAMLADLSAEALNTASDPLPAPAAFSLEVLSRLGETPEAVRRIVTAAAVLGSSCRLADAARLAAVPDPETALEGAVGSGLLAEETTAVDHLVHFSHPLARSAIYHDLGPARRSQLHRRAAELIDDPSDVLWHRIRAAVVPDERLAAQAQDAARGQAHRGSWAAAADHLFAAARLSPDREARERRCTDAVDFLLRGGELARAADLLPVLADALDEAHSGYLHGRLAMLRGLLPQARDHLGRAWDSVEPPARPTVARALGERLALCHYVSGDVDLACEWGTRARGFAGSPTGAPSNLLDISIIALADAGREDEARALVEQASTHGTPVGAGTADRPEPDGFVGRGVVLLGQDDFHGARETFALALSVGRERIMPAGLLCLIMAAETDYWLGAWDDAIDHARTAVSLAASAGEVWLAPACHAVAVGPLAGRGLPAAAERVRSATEVDDAAVIDAAVVDAGVVDAAVVPFVETMILTARVRLAHSTADPAAVVHALEGSLPVAHPEPDEPRWMLWRPIYAEALARTGRPDEASVVLRPFGMAARRRGRRSALAADLRARAAVAAASGREGDAEAAYEEALDLVADLPLPFERSLVELEYSAFLRRRGQLPKAIDLAERARARFVDLAAEPYVERCDKLLAGCGRIVPRRWGDALDMLTPQEIRVARLVADGRSNSAAAHELVLSVKTIEYHLGNVYAKLGLRSRRELASALPAEDSASGG